MLSLCKTLMSGCLNLTGLNWFEVVYWFEGRLKRLRVWIRVGIWGIKLVSFCFFPFLLICHVFLTVQPLSPMISGKAQEQPCKHIQGLLQVKISHFLMWILPQSGEILREGRNWGCWGSLGFNDLNFWLIVLCLGFENHG